MSTPKKKKAGAPKADRGQVFNLRLGPDLDAALARFIDSQDVPPEKTPTIVKAVVEFLTKRGYWPPDKKE